MSKVQVFDASTGDEGAAVTKQGVVPRKPNASKPTLTLALFGVGGLALAAVALFGPQVNVGVGETAKSLEGLIRQRTEAAPVAVIVADPTGSPIQVLELSESSIRIDFDGDGFARQTGWPTGGAGVLVRAEILGYEILSLSEMQKLMEQSPDRRVRLAEDGLEHQLAVWVDVNEDGIIGDGLSGELTTLGRMGGRSISFEASQGEPVSGHQIEGYGTLTLNSGSMLGLAAIRFETNPAETEQRLKSGFSISADLEFLPSFEGRGLVEHSHVAMTQREDLKLIALLLANDLETGEMASFRLTLEDYLVGLARADRIDALGSLSQQETRRAAYLARLDGYRDLARVEKLWPSMAAMNNAFEAELDRACLDFATQAATKYVPSAENGMFAEHPLIFLATTDVSDLSDLVAKGGGAVAQGTITAETLAELLWCAKTPAGVANAAALMLSLQASTSANPNLAKVMSDVLPSLQVRVEAQAKSEAEMATRQTNEPTGGFFGLKVPW